MCYLRGNPFQLLRLFYAHWYLKQPSTHLFCSASTLLCSFALVTPLSCPHQGQLSVVKLITCFGTVLLLPFMFGPDQTAQEAVRHCQASWPLGQALLQTSKWYLYHWWEAWFSCDLVLAAINSEWGLTWTQGPHTVPREPAPCSHWHQQELCTQPGLHHPPTTGHCVKALSSAKRGAPSSPHVPHSSKVAAGLRLLQPQGGQLLPSLLTRTCYAEGRVLLGLPHSPAPRTAPGPGTGLLMPEPPPCGTPESLGASSPGLCPSESFG